MRALLAIVLGLATAPAWAQEDEASTLPPDAKRPVVYESETHLEFDEIGLDVPVERPGAELVFVPPGMYFRPDLPLRQDFNERIEASVSAVH